MDKTIAFVTNQYSCDRLIFAAREVADKTKSDLIVVEVLDSEYKLNPPAVDYLFKLSKKNNATMRMIFSENKVNSIFEAASQYECKYIVTGMPNNDESVLYELWNRFPEKKFYTVSSNGMLLDADVKRRGSSTVRVDGTKACLA